MRIIVFIACILFCYLAIQQVESARGFKYFVQLETKSSPYYSSLNTANTSYWLSSALASNATLTTAISYSETPAFNVTGGNLYTFCLSTPSTNFPFQICNYLGCGNNYTLNLAAANPGLTANNSCFTWTAPPVVVTTTYYYGSYDSAYMGNAITINPDTPCNRYSQALYSSTNATIQLTLINNWISGIFAGSPSITAPLNGCVGTVTGAFNNQSALYPYFKGTHGTFRTTALDFTAGGTPLTTLVTQLSTFFGAILGCTGDDTSTFPAYVATSGLNLNKIHAAMGINEHAFDVFIIKFNQILASYGVSAVDQYDFASTLSQFKAYSDTSNPNMICTASDCLAANVPVSTVTGSSSSSINYQTAFYATLAVAIFIIVVVIYLYYREAAHPTYYSTKSI